MIGAANPGGFARRKRVLVFELRLDPFLNT
jgi:hypothetical protein